MLLFVLGLLWKIITIIVTIRKDITQSATTDEAKVCIMEYQLMSSVRGPPSKAYVLFQVLYRTKGNRFCTFNNYFKSFRIISEHIF